MPSKSPLNEDEDIKAYEKMTEAVQDLSAVMAGREFDLTKEQVFSILKRFQEIAQMLQGQLMVAQRHAIGKQLALMREMWETVDMGKAMAEREGEVGPKTDKEQSVISKEEYAEEQAARRPHIRDQHDDGNHTPRRPQEMRIPKPKRDM